MFVGIGRFDFVVASSTSLKEKRRVVRSLTANLRNKFNLAVAEVEYQDLRQRAALGVACVSNSAFHCKKMLHEVERFVRSQYEIEVVGADTEVITPDA
ncbi:MAG: DUF503 domain-containing protein [Actinomycetota bacterium]